MQHVADPASRAPAFHLRAIRIALIALTVCFIVGGPLARQGFGVREKHLPRWIMFSGIGLGLVDVRYEQVHANGKREVINRMKALKGTHPPKALRRIRGVKDAWKIARALCLKLGEGADVRVKARIATGKGWRPALDEKVNACTTKSPPSRHKKRKAKSEKKPNPARNEDHP